MPRRPKSVNIPCTLRIESWSAGSRHPSLAVLLSPRHFNVKSTSFLRNIPLRYQRYHGSPALPFLSSPPYPPTLKQQPRYSSRITKITVHATPMDANTSMEAIFPTVIYRVRTAHEEDSLCCLSHFDSCGHRGIGHETCPVGPHLQRNRITKDFPI
jgi:hypothetical protein